MWRYLFILFAFFLLPSSCRIVDNKDSTNEVIGVISRLIGESRLSSFNVSVNPSISPNGKNTFSLYRAPTSGVVQVVGSSGVAAAWGFHYYLKKYCHCHISWDGDQLRLPEVFPVVNETITSLDLFKYYQNVCTSSYSFVWWDWSRWEREIDWMALNGINLALAFGGQEAIWRRVFDGFGVVHDNFTGPAFLAWNRMGNMRAFGGGLSSAWHSRSVELQHKILTRMRLLGITPVLPAFNGILPPDFRRVYPQASGTNISKWNNFSEEYCCPFLLSPNDPLFSIVSRIFLREYISEFGTDHIYNSDTFNENTPDSNDPEYLSNTARAIYEGMVEADSEAIWMVQGWMFLNPFWGPEQVKAYVTSIPIGKMLLLDLQSDLTPLYGQFESYYGQPFIFCTLLNFGGQLGMFGHLEKVNKGIMFARNFENSTMVGIGLTPEGIDQNYIMFDFTLDGSLQDTDRNVTDWVLDYITRRYGRSHPDVYDAWQILQETVYNFNMEKISSPKRKKSGGSLYTEHIERNIMTKLPSLRLSEGIWYEKKQVYKAFQLLLSSAQYFKDSSLYAHDLVDVTRQIVQLAVGNLYQRLVIQYKGGDGTGFNETSSILLGVLGDIDTVLKTNKKFLLGPWLEGAKEAASSTEEKSQFEWNARNQITLWGPNGEIRDYAAKQWSGMISDFYKPRWQIFLSALQTTLDGGPRYNRTLVNQIIQETVEVPFTFNTNLYPVEPEGNTIDVVTAFNSTWGILGDVFSEEYLPTVSPISRARNFNGKEG